jgi:hypothetical protein
MSVGASAIGEVPIGAGEAPAKSTGKPPKRTVIAKADAAQAPEAR